MNFNIPPHIRRLILAFAIFIGLFIVARSFLYPVSFGEYGYYRGNTLSEVKAAEIFYAGNASCIECHKDIAEAKGTDLHSDIRCESCHGAGMQHSLKPDSIKLTLPSGREFCGKCHGLNAARLKETVNQVNLDEHNVGHNCIECHNPHKPWELKK
jgi:hypothetical protein